MKRSLALALVLAAAALSSQAADDPKALFEARCSVCHGVDRPLNATKDRAGWEATVKRMQGKAGGLISDADAGAITDYLAKLRAPK